MSRVLRLAAAALPLAAALAGCASAPPRPPVPAAVLAGHPVALMLPLSNLTGRGDQGDIVSRVFYDELARTGAFDLIEYGEVDRLVGSLRLRDTGSPTAAQIQALRDSTGARFILAGSLLEAGTVRAPEGDLPSVGVSLRVIDTGALRAVWAESRFMTGQDHETVFGWGRETSLSRLTSRLAAAMLESFQSSTAAKGSVTGGAR